MPRGEDRLVAAIALVFGVLAWAQMPALCGFMFSSTRAGAENYVYSIWLGGLIALDSKPGHTEFRVALPISPPADTATEGAPS